jgi:PAS domain S-box-containing protein
LLEKGQIVMQEELSREQLLLEIQRLRQEVQDLKRDKADLEILLETNIEHSDTVEAQLQNQAEEAVRESEKRLAQFLEAVPVGVFVVDSSGKPYYANHAAQQLLGKGITPEASEQQLAEVYQVYIAGTNQLYPNAQLPIVQALRGESGIVNDMEIRQGNRTISLEVRATPIFDEKGEIVYAIGAFQDITERKRAEEELQEREKQYRAIFEATSDGLIINNLKGNVVGANPAACRMHGYSNAEFIGLDHKTLIHPDYHSIVVDYLQTIHRDVQFEVQAFDLCKDGTAFPLR